jgi:hypothetical protein
MFRQSFTGSALLTFINISLRLQDFHPLWYTFPGISALYILTFGLFRFRSPLLTESLLFSFPPGT